MTHITGLPLPLAMFARTALGIPADAHTSRINPDQWPDPHGRSTTWLIATYDAPKIGDVVLIDYAGMYMTARYITEDLVLREDADGIAPLLAPEIDVLCVLVSTITVAAYNDAEGLEREIRFAMREVE
jgi:hypothetical protein